MPDQVVAGVALQATDALTLLVDYQLTRWSVFETINLDFANAATPDKTLHEHYTDTHGIRGGFELETSDMFRFRAGYLYHTAASPDETVTPLLPEGRRNEVTVGFGFDIAAGLSADLAYQYIRQDNRRGRVREPLGGAMPTTALNSGVYEFRAHLFGVSLTYAP
jgi:long-chain fatty acid transport protein